MTEIELQSLCDKYKLIYDKRKVPSDDSNEREYCVRLKDEILAIANDLFLVFIGTENSIRLHAIYNNFTYVENNKYLTTANWDLTRIIKKNYTNDTIDKLMSGMVQQLKLLKVKSRIDLMTEFENANK